MNAASVKPLSFNINSQPLPKLYIKNNASLRWTITSIQSRQIINCKPITVKVNCLEIGSVYAHIPLVLSALTYWLLHCFPTLRFLYSFDFQRILELFRIIYIIVNFFVCFLLLQIEQISNNRLLKKDGIAPVATGNWGCGSSSRGDVQLKLVIQWMAASLAGLPVLVYYTSGHAKLAKVNRLDP